MRLSKSWRLCTRRNNRTSLAPYRFLRLISLLEIEYTKLSLIGVTRIALVFVLQLTLTGYEDLVYLPDEVNEHITTLAEYL